MIAAAPGPRESAQCWRDEALGGTEFLHARYLNHRFDPHTHDGYVFGLIEYGVERYRYRRHTHDAPAGAVVVIEPGELHTGEAGAADGWIYRTLYPDAAQVAQAAAERGLAGLPGFRDTVLDDAELARRLRALHAARAAPRLTREVLWQVFMDWLLEHHAAIRPALPPARADVRRARELIDAAAADDLSLDTLAAQAGLSRYHFVRAFKAQVGVPPHRYLIQRRVEQARRALARGESPSAVALASGFADQAHLSRHFKRIVGVSPATYARSSALAPRA